VALVVAAEVKPASAGGTGGGEMQSLVNWLNWGSVAFGLVAAGLWFYATVAKVEDRSTGNWDNPPLTTTHKGRTIDILATAAKQTRLNSYAAAVTALASLSAALSLLTTQLWGPFSK
jgi:hypothetical protein